MTTTTSVTQLEMNDTNYHGIDVDYDLAVALKIEQWVLGMVNCVDNKVVAFLCNKLEVLEKQLSPFVKEYMSFQQLAFDLLFFASPDGQTE
eukprot:7819697-Ditylum_brightwellii.AAC.1